MMTGLLLAGCASEEANNIMVIDNSMTNNITNNITNNVSSGDGTGGWTNTSTTTSTTLDVNITNKMINFLNSTGQKQASIFTNDALPNSLFINPATVYLNNLTLLGRLTIGTTTTTQALNINGTLKLEQPSILAWYEGGSARAQMYSDNSDDFYFFSNGRNMYFYGSTGNFISFRTTAKERLLLEGDGDIVIGEVNKSIFKNNSGFLGINTQTPTQTLDVNGSVNITGEVTINGVQVGLETAFDNNSYYSGADMNSEAFSVTQAPSTALKAYPFIPQNDMTVVEIGSYVATANTTVKNNCSIGVYNNTISGGKNKPNQLMFSCEGFLLNSTGWKNCSVSNVQLKKGNIYWGASKCNSTSTARMNSIFARMIVPILGDQITTNNRYTDYTNTSTTWSAMPSTFISTASLESAVVTAVTMRVVW